MKSILPVLANLDRRWVFLMMGLAVAVPILCQSTFPEKAGPLAEAAFRTIEDLPDGSKVLLSFDYDPASEPELGPMANALVRQCVMKKHKLYFMALWPLGTNFIRENVKQLIEGPHPEMKQGEAWVNLGYQAGNEAVIKQMVTDIPQAYPKDSRGEATSKIPMMQGIQRLRDFDCMIAISAGNPGAKEWVQYGVTPNRGGDHPLRMVGGCTGVGTPQLYPYYPYQMDGLLGAIKGAAEYELLVNEAAHTTDVAKFNEAKRRMGPQLVAHLLMVTLILAGNVIYFATRRRERRA